MIAFRTAADLDLFRPSIVRVHHMPSEAATGQHFAPAMSFPQYITVQQVIDALREMQSETDSIYYLFVTDFDDHLVGVVSLHQLLLAEREARLFELMDRRVLSLSPDASLEEQAHLVSESGLLALPVLDAKGRLIGAMDVSDLITAIQNEATGDMYHLAGLSAHEDMRKPIAHAVSNRVLWLCFSLVAAMLATWVLGVFAPFIAHFAILVAFMPLVVWPVSKAGMQTFTFLVRSMSLGKLSPADVRRILGRELLIGLGNGLGIGMLVGAIGWFWQGDIILGLIVAVATLVNLLLAALLGVVVPLTMQVLHRKSVRPASLCVTAITTVSSITLVLVLGSLAAQMGYL